MRMLLVTAGSRGDVEPFLALGRRAGQSGHEVRLGVTREFAAPARAADLDVVELPGSFAALVTGHGVSARTAWRSYRRVVRPMMAGLLRSAVEAALAFRPDLIVHHPKVLSAPVAAAHLGVPHVLVEIVPTLTPTREFAAAGVTSRDLGPLNRTSYRATRLLAGAFAGLVRDVAAELGVPAEGTRPALTLVPVSPTLLPRPADWPASTQVTGAWHDASVDSRPEARVDGEIEEFLTGGDVLYAGFGSMAVGDPEARGRVVVTAARAVGRRLLVATGWGGLAVPPGIVGDDVLVRHTVPHAAVLPRCRDAVHHGGAGTVHAVVRAGLVSVTVPFVGDQRFWGALLHRRGLGAEPVPCRRLTVDRLVAALTTLPGGDAAAEAARALRGEDGCGRALAHLEQLA